MRLRRPAPHRQQGAAALALTLVLLFVMALAATFASRDLVFEQRTSANQYRSTQAFEAAEAGLQWAEAQLNAGRPLDADCSAAGVGTSFRERYLALDAGTRLWTPRTWSDAGRPTALLPACVASASNWACHCPADGATPPLRASTTAPAPAFSLQFLAGGKPGLVRLVATGCSQLGTPCTPSGAPADASARIEVSLGLLGALRVPPAAALTTGGRIDADLAAFSVRNTDPATGVALHAGGDIAAAAARLTGPPGRAARVVAHDAALAAHSPDRLFASYFGLDRAHWKIQPSVTRVSCGGECGAVIGQALAGRAGSGVLWVDGPLELTGPRALGAPDRPVLLVVDGTVHLRGAVAITGMVYADSVIWDDADVNASTGASVQGAIVAAHDYQGSAAVQIAYSPSVLGVLSNGAGSFARVPGSWHDF